MENFGVSAIHPLAPQMLSAAALFTAPIDIDAALARLASLWGVDSTPEWETVTAQNGSASGRLVHFDIQGVQVLLSGIPGRFQPERGALPEHAFYIPITLFAPLTGAEHGTLAGESPFDPSRAPGLGTDPSTIPPSEWMETRRRKRMVSAHIALTQVADALMREEAAIGLFRQELGVVQPPHMITELAQTLTQGQVPLPLWVNIRIQQPSLTVGRTLGLPLFGHLDLEVLDSTHPGEDVYAELAKVATYLITGDSFLLPGQTLGSAQGEPIALTQEVSPLDQSPVIRVLY